MELEIKSNSNGFFIIIYYKHQIYSLDEEISELMGVSSRYYREKIKNVCNNKIIMQHEQIFIIDYLECIKFKEWLEENIMMYMLLKELNPDIYLE